MENKDIVKYNSDRYLLIPTGYVEGDEFELGNLFGGAVIMRFRIDKEHMITINKYYYDPELYWSIPRELHGRKLTVIGIVSKTEGFNILEEYKDKEYLIIKID